MSGSCQSGCDDAEPRTVLQVYVKGFGIMIKGDMSLGDLFEGTCDR